MSETIVILGGGESGVGAALLAKKLGKSVFVSDLGTIKDTYKEVLTAEEIEYEEGQHSEERILQQADLVIKSPGIPEKVALIQALKSKGIAVIDELEFAAKHTDAKIIAITGSNGKTTTTKLIHHILQTAGYDVGLAGNIGFSLAKQVAEEDKAYYVVEVSSFQLDGMYDFNPDVAVLLNITADHLDRYEYKLENYIASKFRLVQNKGAEQVFVYNSDDVNIAYGLEHYYHQNKENRQTVSMSDLQQESEVLRIGAFQIKKADLTLQGRHNYFNIQCAVQAAQSVGVGEEAIRQALTTFENEAHRLEPVCIINEVEYINDSKATNVDAVYYALDAMTKPVVWIVGGVDKGNDYEMLFPLVKEKVRAIVCLGIDNSKIFEAFQDKHEIIIETRSIREAIKVGSLYAEQGDAILLSPACASFDLFDNYIDRGNQFKGTLMHQIKMMTEGITVTLNAKMEIHPVNNKSDN